MNFRLNAPFLSSSLALSLLMTTPAMADEWNKRTDVEFSAPVQIPGHVLAPGRYVFELLESGRSQHRADFLKGFGWKRKPRSDDPRRSRRHFEHSRQADHPFLKSGAPRSPICDSRLVPGDNTGWELWYPKGQSLEADANTAPASAPAPTSAAPSVTSATAPWPPGSTGSAKRVRPRSRAGRGANIACAERSAASITRTGYRDPDQHHPVLRKPAEFRPRTLAWLCHIRWRIEQCSPFVINPRTELRHVHVKAKTINSPG